MKNIFNRHHLFLLYIALCLTLVCWVFLFGQLISNYILSNTQKAIPAFQSIENTAFKNPPDQNTVYSLLKEYDPDIRMISCHQEKNYTDLYFYSPAIGRKEVEKNHRNFNLQAAITRTHVYFGTPMLQYDF